MKAQLRFFWLFLLRGVFDYRGPSCEECGFSEFAHLWHRAEFDIDNYPCAHFSRSNVQNARDA